MISCAGKYISHRKAGNGLAILAMATFILIQLAPLWTAKTAGNAVLMNCPVHGLMAAAASHKNMPAPVQNNNNGSGNGKTSMAFCPFCMARSAVALHQDWLYAPLPSNILNAFIYSKNKTLAHHSNRKTPQQPRAPPLFS